MNNVFMALSLAVLAVSFWNRNTLPGNINYDPATLAAPKQSRTFEQPFDVSFKGVEYRIEPEYDYELTGMIVSYRHHDYKSRMHRLANDHLNMLDICVVWGSNAKHPDLNKIDFWNGIFTCNFSTRDQAAWDAFDIYQISNNHLLSDNHRIRDRVTDIKIGDQIRVKGYLAGYSSPGVSKRGTSTTRQDTGDGACETIYITDFEIIQPLQSVWRIAMWSALAAFLLSIVIHFAKPHRSSV